MSHVERKPIQDIVIKFVGDSGDGMQLLGSLFSEAVSYAGEDLATFPDFPSEVRAPRNTIWGVSGYQIHFGQRKIFSPGDRVDILVSFNPASLKANLKFVKPGATIIVDDTNFNKELLEKVGYSSNPLTDGSLSNYHVLHYPITKMCIELATEKNYDKKSAEKAKNIFALGMLSNMFSLSKELVIDLLRKKFGKKPEVFELNKLIFETGYHFVDITEDIPVFFLRKTKLAPGKYRNITGNQATAWGLMAAAEKAGLQLFLGSYPITPATEILMELAKHRELGVKTFQAEDEIAGITSAIGASFAGALGATSTSGPGLSLKSEALGLAVMSELPLVVVDVQRAGPSTGMPTKSEQGDLLQALYGRNGEAPLMVIAASSPADCFYAAYEAAKYALEHMTPVILLTDGYIGFGSEVFRIPKMADLPEIKPPFATPNTKYYPYERDPETLVRKWAIPGIEGLRHRIGGLEKTDIYGEVSTDPLNHEKMVKLREEKVRRIARHLPPQELYGNPEGELLVISWGGTFGQVRQAVEELLKEDIPVAHAHFRYIFPLPENTGKILLQFKDKKIVVAELNRGQFAKYLRTEFEGYSFYQYNKVQGQPFTVAELMENFKSFIK